MMSAKNRSLKNILINPTYQIKYVMWVSSAGLTLIAANAIVFYYYVRENYSILVDLSPMDEAAKSQLYKELNEILIKLGAVGVIFVMITAFIGLKMSHRTAGPLYHFKRVFGEIKNGKMDARVRLRPGDDFKDVANAFNEMMDAVQKKS
jgi:methyl-accepting chemotaxis protein